MFVSSQVHSFRWVLLPSPCLLLFMLVNFMNAAVIVSTITALRGTSFLLLPFSSSIQTRSLADFQAVCIHSLAMLPWLCVLMYFMWITHTSLPLLQQRASFPVFSSVYINPPILLKSATDPLLLWFFVLAEQKPISFAHSFCLSLLFFTHLCILVISPWMLQMW